MSGFKSAGPLGVSTESRGELPTFPAASAGISVIKTMGRSPTLGDTWWVCSNEDTFPRGLAQHT